MQQRKFEFDEYDDRDIWTRFDAFDKEHPEIYKYFAYYAMKMIKAGFKHYSARDIFGRVRWHIDEKHLKRGEKTCNEPFRLNNNYTSRYARKFMGRHPEYEGFFSTRELKS